MRNPLHPEALMLRKLPILALLFAFALPHAHADDASKRAKIQELFKLMKLDSLMQTVMKSSMDQGQAMMKGILGDQTASLSDEDLKIVKRFQAKIETIVADDLTWEKLEPDYLNIYATAYTEEEVDGILAFYKSPAGKAMVEKQPQMVAAAQQLVASRMQDIGPRMQQALKDLQTEIEKAHDPSRHPATGKS